ncbi:transmembrane protein 134-like isoform X2 [Amphiura filiformis]|uniref:transmembrane protein 134-like isoform X1 n=1 Tax=Amphiura filiformis TaxID=82378 RepID=UPI003B21023A
MASGSSSTQYQALSEVAAAKASESALAKPLIEGSEPSTDAQAIKESEYLAGGINWWWQHPTIRQNWKAVLACILLLVVGIVLIVAGILVEAVQREHAAAAIFLVVGFLFFIPGLYHTGYAYFAAKGYRGFDMNKLSIFTTIR